MIINKVIIKKKEVSMQISYEVKEPEISTTSGVGCFYNCEAHVDCRNL